MKRLISLAFLTAGVLLSCGEESSFKSVPLRPELVKGYITEYVFPDEIKFTVWVEETRELGGRFTGETVNRTNDSVRFNALSEKYNDTTWNTVPHHMPIVEGEVSCISITSDRRFDELHDAGEPLTDLMEVLIVSYKEFIETGRTSNDNDRRRNVAIMPLNRMKADDWQLADSQLVLIFTKPPVETGEYTFTVTATVDDREITGTATIEF